MLAVWLPAVAGFALLAHATYRSEAEDARDDVARFAQSLSLLVERELDKRIVMATTLSASRALSDGDLEGFHGVARLATQATGNWVVLEDRNFQYLNTLADYDGQVRDRPAGAPFVTDEPRVIFAPRGVVAPGPVLTAYAPDRSGGSPHYNVGVAFSPQVLQALIDTRTPVGSLASVIDHEHVIVARSRDPQKWVGVVGSARIQERVKTRTGTFEETVTLDGVPSITYVSKANRHGWNVVLALPKESLTIAAWRLTLQALAAAGALLLIGLALAIFVARRIGQPIEALRDAAEVVGRDEVPPPLATGVAEVDAVGRALEVSGRRSQEATRTLQQQVAAAVTEARQAQAALLEGQKREAIGRLTGGFAHDFNNLLQTISTGLHIVDRHTGSDAAHRRYLDAAMRATGKAADLVRRMMTFGRAQPLRPRAVDLRDFVLQTQELTRKAVGERVRLTADIERGLPPVRVDAAQLELALLNLVFNARDAMPEGGGAIHISAHMAQPDDVAHLSGPAYLCLEVRDDGSGMDAATLARAFDPYFTTKPVGSGTGLGLAQVLAFARQSNGDARLESAPGEGTRVQLLLPLADRGEAVDTGDEPAAAPRGPMRALRILMVEDDSLVSSVVAPALREAGHEVLHCESADLALELLQSRSDFDVLFSDVVMPGRLSGLDLVDWCRTHRPAIRAVVATGYSSRRTRDDVQELRKPYGLEDLLDALQRAIETPTDDTAAAPSP